MKCRQRSRLTFKMRPQHLNLISLLINLARKYLILNRNILVRLLQICMQRLQPLHLHREKNHLRLRSRFTLSQNINRVLHIFDLHCQLLTNLSDLTILNHYFFHSLLLLLLRRNIYSIPNKPTHPQIHSNKQ